MPWQRHARQLNYEILSVSQFTLYGTLGRRNQPDYKLAMKAEKARGMYNQFLELLRVGYERDKIKDGAFSEMMDVGLVNDGPVTLVIDSRDGGSSVGRQIIPSEPSAMMDGDGEEKTEGKR